MSAKIAVISSNTWLIGWMRPASIAARRSGRLMSSASRSSRASSASAFSAARRAASASFASSFSALIAAPALRRSSGDIAPSVASRAEIVPFLPSAATRAASSAASSLAAAIAARVCSRREERSVIRQPRSGTLLPLREKVAAEGRRMRGRAARRMRRAALARRPLIRRFAPPSPARGEGKLAAQAALGRWPLALSTIAAKAAGSLMARSDSTLRSTSTPAAMRPAIRRE